MRKCLGNFRFSLLFSGHHQSSTLVFHLQDYGTTESYEVSLVTISRQPSYDTGIPRQEYGIIQGLPMKHSGFADWVTVLVVHVHLPERAETGGPKYPIGLDCAGRA